MSLLFLAICATPASDLEIAFPWEKEVIHREIQHLVKRPRFLQNRSLDSLCNCNINGECLCYLDVIKEYYMETAWHTEDDYQTIGDWIWRN